MKTEILTPRNEAKVNYSFSFSPKVLCLLIVLLIFSFNKSIAYDFKIVDGVAYKWLSHYKYAVTSLPNGEYKGNIVIPTDLRINGDYQGNVVSIAPNAFAGCDSLKSVKIEGLYIREIGDSAFFGSPMLETVEMSDSVNTIGKSIFENCVGLKIMPYISKKAVVGERLFAGCIGLEEVVIQDNCNYMVKSVFEGCANLKQVTLSKDSIMSDNMFVGCDNLKEIIVRRTVPNHKWNGSKFFSDVVYENAVLKVPIGRKSEYHNANEWSKFINIEEDKLGYIQINVDNGVGGNVSLIDSEDRIFKVAEGCTDILNVEPNQTVTLHFDGAIGMDIDSLIIDGKYIEANHIKSYKIDELSESINVRVVYKPCTHKIRLVAGAKGETYITNVSKNISTTSVSDTIVEYEMPCNSKINITTIPDYGYQVKKIVVNNVEHVKNGVQTRTITQSLDTDLDVLVEFERMNLNLSIYVKGEGDVVINGKEIKERNGKVTDLSLRYGDTLKIKTIPIEGYETSLLYVVGNMEMHTLKGAEGEIVLNEDYFRTFILADFSQEFGLSVVFRRKGEYVPSNPTYGELTYSYNDSTATAIVTGGKCEGDLIIPSTIEKDGMVYTIVSLGINSFRDNNELKYVKIPATVKTIEGMAFYACKNLERVDFSSDTGLQSIDYFAFALCENLLTIDLPKTLKNIGGYAFYQCEVLDNIIIPEGVESLHSYNFANCVSLRNITFPNSLKTLGTCVFSFCCSLQEIKLTDDFTNLGLATFINCSNLETIYLGKYMDSFGTLAFSNCGHIEEINVLAKNPLGNPCMSFSDIVLDRAVLKVPKNRASAYRENSNWCEFKNIVEDESLGWYNSINVINGDFGSLIIDGDEVLAKGKKEYVVENGDSLYIKVLPNNGYSVKVHITKGEEHETFELTDSVFAVSSAYNNTKLEIIYEEIWNKFTLTSKGLGMVKYGDELLNDSTAIYSLRYGSSAEIYFYTMNGYMVKSFKVNDNECVDDLNYGYSYRISPIENDMNVVVEFGEIKSGVYGICSDNISVAVVAGEIRINGCGRDFKVEVYDINGACVYSGSDTVIPVNGKGLYVVVVNGKAHKVMV